MVPDLAVLFRCCACKLEVTKSLIILTPQSACVSVPLDVGEAVWVRLHQAVLCMYMAALCHLVGVNKIVLHKC